MFLKLARIFFKLSALKDDLIEEHPDAESFIEYLADNIKDEKLLDWAFSHVLSGQDPHDVEDAVKLYMSGRFPGELGDFTPAQLSKIIENKYYRDTIPISDLETDKHDSLTYKGPKVLSRLLLPKYGLNFKKFLDAHDIKLLPSSKDENAMLGTGMFGVVYDALYNGNRVAMKVADPNDTKGYIKVMEQKHKLPPFVAKHFPEIYLAEVIKDDNGHSFGVVIMEILEPISSDIMISANWGTNRGIQPHFDLKHDSDAETATRPNFTAKSPEKDHKEVAASRMASFYDRFLERSIRKALSTLINTAINDRDIDLIIDHLYDDNEFLEMYKKSNLLPTMVSNFLNVLNKTFPMTVMKKINEFGIKNGVYIDVNTLCKKITKELYSHYYSYVDPVPGKYTEKDILENIESSSERLDEFLRALKYLVDHTNIEFNDIHGGNVMERPSDGSLVISDLGYFR